MRRTSDREPVSGPKIAQAQIAAFREWEEFSGERFADLKNIQQPTLIVNGVFDEMIPIANSYRLGENLPNAVLMTYPDAAHGSLFQYPEILHVAGDSIPRIAFCIRSVLRGIPALIVPSRSGSRPEE